MAITYCNTTSDLTNAHRDIDRYKGYFELDSTKWSLVSGSTYRQYETGYISKIFENGSPFTAATNSTAVDTAGEYYYDSTNDAVYIYCTAGANPNTKTIEAGETWSTFKTTCRNDAQELLEGFLRSRFIIPFQKVISPRTSYNSQSYDYWIVRATALLTCHLIIKRLNPNDITAERLFKEIFNPDPEPGEQKGIIQMILDGDVILNIQQANREPGGFNVYENASQTATAFAKITGFYTGHSKQVWRVQIDGAGAVGTATFKLSRDGGTNWDTTLQKTRDTSTDERRILLGSGIYIEFVGTFGSGDYWDIELFPASDTPEVSQFGTVSVLR